MTAPQAITFQQAITAVWGVWIVAWVVGLVWQRPNAQRQFARGSALHWILTLGGWSMLFSAWRRSPLPSWHGGPAVGWAMAAIVTGAFLFALWARLHLGALWSASIVHKQNHRVVDDGPYAVTRHPIYTGFIVGGLATAFAIGHLLAIVGAVVAALGFWIKARLEEDFLRQNLGAGAYDFYRARVPMLVPFWPVRPRISA